MYAKTVPTTEEAQEAIRERASQIGAILADAKVPLDDYTANGLVYYTASLVCDAVGKNGDNHFFTNIYERMLRAIDMTCGGAYERLVSQVRKGIADCFCAGAGNVSGMVAGEKRLLPCPGCKSSRDLLTELGEPIVIESPAGLFSIG